jgi:hypothetical protein
MTGCLDTRFIGISWWLVRLLIDPKICSRCMHCFLPLIQTHAETNMSSRMLPFPFFDFAGSGLSRAWTRMRRNRGEKTRPLLQFHSHASGSFGCIGSIGACKQCQLVRIYLFVGSRQCSFYVSVESCIALITYSNRTCTRCTSLLDQYRNMRTYEKRSWGHRSQDSGRMEDSRLCIDS